MARLERFTFVIDRQEKAIIAELANRLHRSQSDAVRFVVLSAAQHLAGNPTGQEKFNLCQEANVESLSTAA